MRIRAIIIPFVALATATCGDGPPTAPEDPVGLPAMGVSGSASLRAAVKNAVDDSRLRIVPSFRADPRLGGLQATKDLASALDELATALAQPTASLDRAIRRASQAITALQDAVKRDAGRAADLTVVRLAVERAKDVGRTCC